MGTKIFRKIRNIYEIPTIEFSWIPLFEVNSLHLHLVDMKAIGPTFKKLDYKNCPLNAVLKAFGWLKGWRKPNRAFKDSGWHLELEFWTSIVLYMLVYNITICVLYIYIHVIINIYIYTNGFVFFEG